MAQDNTKAVIEALLFSSDRPLTVEQIKNVLSNLDAVQIRHILIELASDYEKNNSGMRITEIAGGFQMVSSANLAPFLKKLYKQKNVERLSRQALETLAIIAYKQPLTRLEIESIRNVNIDGVMKTLLDKELIRIAGRKKTPGRPKVWATTRQFLEYFGLKSLEELPKIENFSALIDKNVKEEENDTAKLA